MAYSNDQNEPKLPTSNADKRYTADLLPRYYRTGSNKKFLQATLDQLNQPGTVKKINGYVGRQNAKAVTSKDIFLDAADKTRQDYQFEPAAVIQDYLNNTTFFKDYIDHINHVSVFDGITNNHSRINKEEFYSWNPHIDWDKFVNYQQYYWMPFGPSTITVLGQQQEIISTYTVKAVDEVDNVAYLFTPNGLTLNPTLTLYRGQTYHFDIDAEGHPFSIKTTRTAGMTDRYTQGVVGSQVEHGTITFTVPKNSPDVLYYVSENAVDTGGVFHVLNIEDNTAIDLDADLLGKKTYVIPNGSSKGLELSNGMKLHFGGRVTPAQYGADFWYVEGVGTAIKLVRDKDLEVRTSYNVETAILFDDTPFDQLPFGDSSNIPSKKDYITINRSSPDLNSWSRYNRWFHQDVIIASATATGNTPELNQLQRATRPIIEFNAGLKLFNHGINTKKRVDVIDSFTTDVFSTIEGSLGYNIDGIDLVHGMRVLFTADTDPLVRNKIYNCSFIDVTIPQRKIYFKPDETVDAASSRITFASEHGLTSADRIIYIDNGHNPLQTLTNQQVYYVKVINTITIELHTVKTLNKQVRLYPNVGGTHILEIFAEPRHQIMLTEEPDATPNEFDTVTINYGTNDFVNNDITGNQGQSYWFNGTDWKLAQIKTQINQAPLFDVFDTNGNSYSSTDVYDGSTFAGTKIFSYKVGSGTADTELLFPLTYQNINNIGDIVFEFNLLSDKFAYKSTTEVLYKNTDVGYLKIVTDNTRYEYANGWTVSSITDSQPVVRVFKESNLTNNFPVDVFDKKDQLTDLEVRVYINGKRLNKTAYSVETGTVRKYVKLNSDVALTDVVTLRCFSKQPKNQNGYYELPNSLQNNPLNNNMTQFTLGEAIDHVDSIIDNISGFSGIYPGNGNLRDLGNLNAYGSRFLQHSGPMNLSLYHLGSKDSNVIKAMDQARNDYGKFKRAFLIAANESGIDTDPRRHVNQILQTMFVDKPKNSPYFLSDMFGYGAVNRLEYTILDPRIKTYPLTAKFNLAELSNKAVNIYLNGEQLTHGIDYVFGSDVYFEVLATLQEDDILEAFEFETTDGAVVPPTPTKLGLYPKFEPKIYEDDTYLEKTKVIQGHDGSITVAFNDFRDDLILELEKRIFNNIKVNYDTSIFDIYEFIPSYDRVTDYSRVELDKILSKYFYQWTTNIQQDYTKHTWYDQNNKFTFNYRGNFTPDNKDVPASWRGIYRWLLDTDRPHTNPWECLGYSIEPSWWQDVYGPAPYTSDNLVLWDDLRQGITREPGVPVRRNNKFAKTILSIGAPVDDSGKLIDPINAGYVQGTIQPNDNGYFVFGDQAVVETAWRRSSYYPFALIESALMMAPNSVLGRCLDRSRITRNATGQLIYSDTGLRIRLADIMIPSTANKNSGTRVYTAGLINYVVDYITSENIYKIENYASDLQTLTNQMASKIGAFTNKNKYQLLLDSKTPSATGGVFVPEEDYFIDLNISSAVKKVSYSGVVITKFADGFEVRGYNFDNPYFTYYPHVRDGVSITVGGISESYSLWTERQQYIAGMLVQYSNSYYRVLVNHTTGTQFEDKFYTRIPDIPIVGGRTAFMRRDFDRTSPEVISYGTKLTTIQAVVDFLLGYGNYLEEQGFVFSEFNNVLGAVTNWETSAKEFMFWSTQHWAVGAVISLSPSADKIMFNSVNSVVDDITSHFYGYSVFRVDGQKLEPEYVNAYRSANEFTIEPNNTNHGIFGITLYLLQKEHIVVINNRTLFNDVIYDPEAGYRQERIKILGYVTSGWNGGFEIPGFIYDRAIVMDWNPWTDYHLGDIVKYKEFFYSASKFLPGTETFESANWVLLTERPTNGLLPNFNYKAEQFTDFYDLDSDNLDAGQQKIAQHLIGYQKRQYLENIIQNDVSEYKFYQGMIIEKGTQNVLNKLFDVLSADGMESLTFDEEWAFRVGEYGAVDTFEEVEFVLNESNFKINPQPIELVNSIDPTITDYVYRQIPADVYIKPQNYTSNLWPIKNNNNFLRSAGYVRKENVKAEVDTLDDLIGTDVNKFVNGDYVWTAFEGRNWNVYRVTPATNKIIDVTYVGTKLTITCQNTVTVSVDDVIGINQTATINGFYKVKSVALNSFTVTADIKAWKPFEEQNTIVWHTFESQRVESIDYANTIIKKDVRPDELIWTDDNGTGAWSVYEHNGVFRSNTIDITNPASNLQFGTSVSITDNGNIAAIADKGTQVVSGSNQGGVTIYEKSTGSNGWKATTRIEPRQSWNTTQFGAYIKLSRDGAYLAITDTAAGGSVYIYKRSLSGEYFYTVKLSSSIGTDLLFGSNIAWGYNGAHIIAITAKNVDDSGAVYVYRSSNWLTPLTPIGNIGTDTGTMLSYDLAMSSDATLLVISNPLFNDRAGIVKVYRLSTNTYSLAQTLGAPPHVSGDTTLRFGQSISVSSDGQYLAVSAAETDIGLTRDVGQVLIFKISPIGLPLQDTPQVINSTTNEINENFGYDIEFLNGSNSLAIFSLNGDARDSYEFDSGTTTFDDNSMTITDTSADSGRVDVYDRYNNNFIYGESLPNFAAPLNGYGLNVVAGQDTILVSAVRESTISYPRIGAVYSYARPSNSFSWTALHTQLDAVNTSRIKKAFLYNKKTNELVTYLDVVDTINGKIPGPADQEIKYKTYYDPAIYSTGNSTVNVDDGMNWTKNQVGQLWWDLTRARFLDSASGDATYRANIWNKLYDTASIDIYEWVETNLLPSVWNKQADTEAGLAKGISGKTKYADDVYSIKQRYDSISQQFKNTYYYWVKNKKIIPAVAGRFISAYDVSSLIADPVGYGYPCIAFTSSNSFSLVNVKKYLSNVNIVLTVQYWLTDYKTNNFHSEWKLLSTNPTTIIPKELETKWFHSLTGKDTNDRVVPDITLPVKQRYGIEFKPRQSMFVNRVEALKQFIERANSVLKTHLIADDYDLTDLMQYDPLPTTVSSLWDAQVDTESELRFISTLNLSTASVIFNIKDGRLIDSTVVNSGYGYGKLRAYGNLDDYGNAVQWYGPYVSIAGTGVGAVAQTILDSNGSVVGVEITNKGEGYDSLSTAAIIRPFAVLVKSDSEALNNWSIYSYENKKWIRSKNQGYDARKYWQYIDWYGTYIDSNTGIEETYSQFTRIDHLVENTYELVTTEINIGEIVKVKNIGSGGWLLLIKTANNITIDYTQNYNVIGRENGTIQFLSRLYDFQASTVGYDGPLFDADVYDNNPSIELKIILNAIKDKILIDEFYQDYLELFFASVRYALTEQTFIDWAFKTSFVKSMHNVGMLKQKVTYNNDNLSNFEDYIKEVKPYRTKIREYVSNYSSLDLSRTSVSDFDLLPVISQSLTVTPLTVKVVDGEIQTDYSEITQDPWTNWADNVGFEITEIKIVDQGGPYITEPVVKVNGVQLPGGTPAKINAYIASGKVNRLELLQGGTRWTSAPIITITGGLDIDGVDARAVAIIGNSVPRTNFMKVKFDRTSRTYEITNLRMTETFTGTGTQTQFKLKWAPDIVVGTSYVEVANVEVLRDDYTLSLITSTVGGYTSYSGLMTFKVAPAAGSYIVIDYNKDHVHLNAADRIDFYYKPQTGQVGKDLAQLMTGIDYGGVEITGIGFNINVGWDSLPWFSDAWDSIDPTFTDYIVTVSTVGYQYRMPYVPEIDQQVNIYISRYDGGMYQPAVRIDDPNYLTINQTNNDAIMTTFTGDGETDIIVLPTTAVLEVGDRIIFRQETSDGSYGNYADEYDTAITGGDLAYQTATGLAPDDIILDGDGLITPESSHAPEEIVPGHIADALAIKVYHRPSGGCPKIIFANHLGDGITTTFKIGQFPTDSNSLFVKVNNELFDLTTNYTIDGTRNAIVFNTAPAFGDKITVLSIGFNAEEVLDLDYFVSDGVATEYLTKAPWLPNLGSTVLVDGEVLSYVLFSTDENYTDVTGQTWRSRVGIRFQNPPPANALINFIISNGEITQTASIIRTEYITADGTADSYELTNPVGVNAPLEQNVIALIGSTQEILKPPSANYFTVENNNLVYPLKDYKYKNIGLNSTDIQVYKDSTLLRLGAEYGVEFDYSPAAYSILEPTLQNVGGLNYQVGDVLDAVGGTLAFGGNAAKVQVTQVTAVGTIRRVEILDNGQYSIVPEAPIELIGGHGTGATLIVEFELIADPANITVNLAPTEYTEGSKLTVIVNKTADYFIDNGNIVFSTIYPADTVIEVITAYNHNILGIERTVDVLIPTIEVTPNTPEYYELSAKLGGSFKLRSTVISGEYVWIVKNGQLMMHGVDYVLEEDFITIKLKDHLYAGDTIQVFAFTNVVVHESFGYMQFKDMLNRVHYKRLNAAKTTVLARALTQLDTEIVVADADVLDTPAPSKNVPGIIEISGERIEYFTKVGSVLGQLRRGTLGTSIPEVHAINSRIQNLGASETIPYKDKFVTTRYSIEINDDGVISLPYIPSVNDMEVFVGGYRLKKNAYSIYSNTDYPSYDPYRRGDVTLNPEFTVSGRAELVISNIGSYAPGTQVVVVKKQGKLWNDLGHRLATSDNTVANFIKSTKALLP